MSFFVNLVSEFTMPFWQSTPKNIKTGIETQNWHTNAQKYTNQAGRQAQKVEIFNVKLVFTFGVSLNSFFVWGPHTLTSKHPEKIYTVYIRMFFVQFGLILLLVVQLLRFNDNLGERDTKIENER